jgi:hypothetical protein
MSARRGLWAAALLLSLSAAALPWPASAAAPGDPVVSIDFPFSGDVLAGAVNISGTSENALLVNVSVDGGGWNRAAGVDSWRWSWDTTGYPDGPHTLLASAVNGSRSSSVASVQVIVNNTAPSRLDLSLDVESRTVYSCETFAVSGLARFDTGVRPAGLAVRITAGNATLNATTDRRGYYSANILAPASPGDLPLRAEASSSGLSASAQDRVSVVPRAAADLSVSPADIRFTPAQPFSDEETTVSAVVRNAGGGNATARVNFSTPGLPNASVQVSVPAGESRNPSAVWKLSSGNHTVNVTISDIQPYDSNSSNDEASSSIVVLARPDLVMAAVVASNSRPYAGLNITLQARVNNTGDREASGTVNFYDGPPVSGKLIGSRPVSVAARSSSMVFIGWNASGPGEHLIHAVVADVTPREATAANNQLERAVSVRNRPAAPEPEGAIPGAGAAAALAALGVFMARKALRAPKS